MDIDADAVHVVLAYVAVLLGVLGPVVSVLYALRVERRDFWRKPMLVSGALTFLVVLGAYLSGRWLVSQRPGMLEEPGVSAHLEYADRLLVPGAGYFVAVVLTGVLHARAGALRIVLPMLLVGFSVVLLLLVVLSGDEGARMLLDRLRGQLS